MDNENIEIIEENNKKKGNKGPYVTAILMALLLVITITATSYAYFTANVSGTGQNNVVTTTSLEIEFSDGPQVSLNNALPGTSVEKTFKIENKGSGDTTYDVYMSDLINTFADKSDLVYTLTSSDGGANISETQVPDVNTKIVQNQLLRENEEHNYVLRITFKETNDNQDDNKGKEFSVTIRVNEEKEATKPAVVVIKEKDVVDDETDDHNLRYIGADPDNYVLFNDELWRIIGVMNNIETESGQTQSLLKIIRNESLGSYSWDTSASDVNNGYGVNEWSQADIMQELNNDYLGNVQVGTDGYWYNGSNNTKTAAMPSTMINNEAQNMMESVVWNLGSPNINNGTHDFNWTSSNNGVTAPISYIREKNNYSEKMCTNGYDCNDTVTRTTRWIGRVALIYPSDYLFATSGGSTTNRERCLNIPMSSWNDSEGSDCVNNTWLSNFEDYQWTLSTYPYYSDSYEVFSIRGVAGHVLFSSAYDTDIIKPVIYLKSSVKITGGSGTSTNPYTLE